MTKTIDVARLPIESWKIDDIVPYPQNAKKHSAEKTTLLAKSIARIGIANPIHIEPKVFADGVENPNPYQIITGHGRRLAAVSLGWVKIPVVVRTDLTKAECDALRIADNTTTSNEYDTELLKAEIAQLEGNNFEMDTLGFDQKELETLTSNFGDLDDDAFVEDINEAVETQKTENAQTAIEVDASAAPVGDALGFKRLTVEQSRAVRTFMSKIEVETGLQGAAALVQFIEDNGYTV